MPSTSGENIATERPSTSSAVRFSRRATSDIARSSLTEPTSMESSHVDAPRKRSRISMDISTPAPRKTVTVTVKAQDTEEFHSPNVTDIQSGDNVSSKNGSMTPQPLPPDASNTEKVISVINFLRDRRRRPDERVVIVYSERMYQMSATEAKLALQSLVEEGRIFRVKYPSGISYRYHMSVVARGDTITQQTNKIRAKYAVAASKSNGTLKTSASRTLTPIGEDTFSGVEMTALRSFFRLMSPANSVVRPSHLTQRGDCSVVDRVRALFPVDILGEDASQNEPGVSVYVLPPPTPVSLETVEKALKSLPHMTSVCKLDEAADSNSALTSHQNGRNGVRSEEEVECAPRALQSTLISGLLSVHSIISDPAMSIFLRRRPSEGFTELWIRSPGSTLRNAFTLQVLSELTEALRLTEADGQVRAVLLSGVGRVFSSGIDLPSLSATSTSTNAAFVDSLVDILRVFLLKLSSFPKLLVAGVNGPAEGLATAILPLFDLVYASDIATFHMAYSTLGQVPEAGATFTFTRMLGGPLASDLLLAGRRLSAREALQRGFISDLLFPKNFTQEVTLRCARIAGQSAVALETTKCLSRMCDRERIDFMINAECHKLAEIWKTPEFRVAAANYIQHCMDDFL